MEAILFYILALLAMVSAVLAITRVNPLATALWLIGCLLAIGGLFGLLDAPVVALFQILLAAGAIMVLFIFVIMLVNLEWLKGRVVRFAKILGVFAAAYFAFLSVLIIMRIPLEGAPTIKDAFGAPKTLGRLLVYDYALPFELISVLMVVAMVGAVVMGQKHRIK